MVKGCDGKEDDDAADAADAAAAAAAGGGSSVDGVVGVREPRSCGTAAASFWLWPSGGFQRGHFFASAESSGTSTISLSLRSQRLNRKKKWGNRNGRTHTTSSPANRCRFTILTIRFSGSLLSGSVDGALLTDSWNLAHNACRSLQLLKVLLTQKDVPHLFAAAKSSWEGERPSTRGRLESRSSEPEVSESRC